jgi:prepilin-type N-terminal cleavage/methylation domain-containing protein
MLDAIRHTIRHILIERLRDERGFTLIELLVAMVAGVAVTAALFSILDVSLRQTARLTDKVQVDQIGRTTMTHIVDELHSSCIAYEFAPVLTKSSENELRFINAYGAESVISGAAEHRIKWESGSKTLIEKSYASTGGSWPKFTFSSTASPSAGVRIGENISQTVKEGTPAPIFEYFKYSSEATSTEHTPLSALKATLEGNELSVKEAEEAAAVSISFTQSPTNGYSSSTGQDRNGNLTSRVTLAFSVPNNETPIHDAPCQ